MPVECDAGIDPNDATKTTSTLEFYAAVLLVVPLVICKPSAITNGVADSAHGDSAIDAESLTDFTDWVLEFLDKVCAVAPG
jgi:hypothetical protein